MYISLSILLHISEIETQSSTSIKPERLPASRFRIFPNTTWKNGSNVCLHFNNRLMPAYNSDVIRTELLPLMDSRDFVWISIKDYGLSCELREGDLIYEGLTWN